MKIIMIRFKNNNMKHWDMSNISEGHSHLLQVYEAPNYTHMELSGSKCIPCCTPHVVSRRRGISGLQMCFSRYTVGKPTKLMPLKWYPHISNLVLNFVKRNASQDIIIMSFTELLYFVVSAKWILILRTKFIWHPHSQLYSLELKKIMATHLIQWFMFVLYFSG